MKKITLAIVLLLCAIFLASCAETGGLEGQWVNGKKEIYEYCSDGTYTISSPVYDKNGNLINYLVETSGMYLADGEILKEFEVEVRKIDPKTGEYSGKITSNGKINEYYYQVAGDGQIVKIPAVTDDDGNTIGYNTENKSKWEVIVAVQ